MLTSDIFSKKMQKTAKLFLLKNLLVVLHPLCSPVPEQVGQSYVSAPGGQADRGLARVAGGVDGTSEIQKTSVKVTIIMQKIKKTLFNILRRLPPPPGGGEM